MLTSGILAHFALLLLPIVQFLLRTTGVVNTVRPLQLVDNCHHWTLFTALDRSQ